MASFGPPIPNRYWPCERADIKGALHGWHTGDIPICLSATLCAQTKTLEAALPWLNLKGISSGEMGAALKVLLGSEAKSLSANTVSRLKGDWAKEYDGLRDADLDDEPIVYIRADGVHNGLRGENDKLCALVIVGVTARGQKRLLAIEDGVRESTQSWREVLLSLKSRGMNAPKRTSGTVPWGSGPPWMKCILKPASSGAGNTKR